MTKSYNVGLLTGWFKHIDDSIMNHNNKQVMNIGTDAVKRFALANTIAFYYLQERANYSLMNNSHVTFFSFFRSGCCCYFIFIWFYHIFMIGFVRLILRQYKSIKMFISCYSIPDDWLVCVTRMSLSCDDFSFFSIMFVMYWW